MLPYSVGSTLLGCPTTPLLSPLDDLHAFKTGLLNDSLMLWEKKKVTRSHIIQIGTLLQYCDVRLGREMHIQSRYFSDMPKSSRIISLTLSFFMSRLRPFKLSTNYGCTVRAISALRWPKSRSWNHLSLTCAPIWTSCVTQNHVSVFSPYTCWSISSVCDGDFYDKTKNFRFIR